MMDFAAYEAAVCAWVEDQLNITAQFRHQAGGWQSKTRARLNFFASRDLGVDELRYAVDATLPTGEDFVPTVNGNRQLTLSVLIQSRDQRPQEAARYLLEKLRTSLRKPSVKESLYLAGLAYVNAENIVNLDETVDDRIESRASMDVHFNAVAVDRDIDEGGSYVDIAQIASTLTDSAGNDRGWPGENFGNI